MNSIRILGDKLSFRCKKCGHKFVKTGERFLHLKVCPYCKQEARQNKFLTRFKKAHCSNMSNYVLIGFTKHFVIMKHNTHWCQHVYTVEYEDYTQNCPKCYAGTSWDVNEHFVKNHKIHRDVYLLEFHVDIPCVFYCSRCNSYFNKWKTTKVINCPLCDSKEPYKKLINTILKTVKPVQYHKDKCKKYAQYFDSSFKIVYLPYKKHYFVYHKCLDGHYRVKKIDSHTFKSRKQYVCPYCKHIRQVNKLKNKLVKYNPDYVLVSKYVNYITPVVLLNIKYGFLIVKKYSNRDFSRRFKGFNLLDNYSKINYLQYRMDKLYGKLVYKVRSINEETNEATITHLLCNHSYVYKIESIISFDVRCKYCRRPLGEQTIINVLESLNIAYKSPAIIGAKREGYDLHYDFLLPKYNILIEYDGVQHYQPISKMGGTKSFKRRQLNDRIKTEYAKENGYHLFRINYNVRKFCDIKRMVLNACSRFS